MKKILIVIILSAFSSLLHAQKENAAFHAHLVNKEYQVFLTINFYDQNITVPGQELYGELPGYLGKQNNTFCWIITDAKLKDEKTAECSLINDYGSEDLTALLTCLDDSTYVLKQMSGSALKVPKNGKWQKLPKTLELKKK